MKNYLGRIVILVDDYEKAAIFYEKNFGFKRTFDVSTDVGHRFLHMGAEPTDSLGIWFIKSDGKTQRERVGNQTSGQPTMVIYTTSIDEAYQQLTTNKVTVTVKPVKTPAYQYLHCLDLYGNEIVLVELSENVEH